MNGASGSAVPYPHVVAYLPRRMLTFRSLRWHRRSTHCPQLSRCAVPPPPCLTLLLGGRARVVRAGRPWGFGFASASSSAWTRISLQQQQGDKRTGKLCALRATRCRRLRDRRDAAIQCVYIWDARVHTLPASRRGRRRPSRTRM